MRQETSRISFLRVLGSWKRAKVNKQSAPEHNSPGLKIGLSSPFDHVILQLEKVSGLGDSLLFAIDMNLFVFTFIIFMLKWAESLKSSQQRAAEIKTSSNQCEEMSKTGISKTPIYVESVESQKSWTENRIEIMKFGSLLKIVERDEYLPNKGARTRTRAACSAIPVRMNVNIS